MLKPLLENISKKIADNNNQFVLTLSDPLPNYEGNEKKCVVKNCT